MSGVTLGAHKQFIRHLPCCVCGENTSVECAHVRYSDMRVAKDEAGMGRKPSDVFTVPLCNRHHREQHSMGERRFWKAHNIDPVFLALALYGTNGDVGRGERIIQFWKQMA